MIATLAMLGLALFCFGYSLGRIEGLKVGRVSGRREALRLAHETIERELGPYCNPEARW